MRLIFSRKRQITQLKVEQTDLEKQIDSILSKTLYDQLNLQKLRRQAVFLQKQIVALENRKVPEIIA